MTSLGRLICCLPNKRIERTPRATLVPQPMSAAHARHVGQTDRGGGGMRAKYMVLLSVLAVGVACAACTSGASQAPPAVGRSQQLAESVQASPTVETAWFWSDSGIQAPLFRMVSFIGNPGPKALTGVQLEWIAYDASNSLVGTHKTTVPTIPPGAKIPYVAGAGSLNLSGIPAKVELRVADKGSFVDTAAAGASRSRSHLVDIDLLYQQPGIRTCRRHSERAGTSSSAISSVSRSSAASGLLIRPLQG